MVRKRSRVELHLPHLHVQIYECNPYSHVDALYLSMKQTEYLKFLCQNKTGGFLWIETLSPISVNLFLTFIDVWRTLNSGNHGGFVIAQHTGANTGNNRWLSKGNLDRIARCVLVVCESGP